ncbi:hypothetical protein BC835DRAFT_957882 [Cytidiella melzeri]|nr:hypothetical protein BC835DRAFT_957882 [Cytidiella melzeri]
MADITTFPVGQLESVLFPLASGNRPTRRPSVSASIIIRPCFNGPRRFGVPISTLVSFRRRGNGQDHGAPCGIESLNAEARFRTLLANRTENGGRVSMKYRFLLRTRCWNSCVNPVENPLPDDRIFREKRECGQLQRYHLILQLACLRSRTFFGEMGSNSDSQSDDNRFAIRHSTVLYVVRISYLWTSPNSTFVHGRACFGFVYPSRNHLRYLAMRFMHDYTSDKSVLVNSPFPVSKKFC